MAKVGVERVRELFDELQTLAIPNHSEPRGCSEAELQALEERLGSPLPAAYRTFLQLGGKDLGGVLRGSTVGYDDLDDINSWSRELFEEYGQELRQGAFAFFIHGGYTMSYFMLGGSDDPEVFIFAESDSETVPSSEHQYDHFTEWLAGEVASERYYAGTLPVRRRAGAPGVSTRVIRTGVRKRGLWASVGAKALLFVFFAAWLGLLAVHMTRGFNPVQRSPLLALVFGAAVADALRRTFVESWTDVPTWVRWLLLAILGVSMVVGIHAL